MRQQPTYSFNFLKITFLLLLYMLGYQSLLGQQESQYTQYMYNTSTINPAYAGSQEEISGILLYRNQWLGIDGAPKTLNFTIASQLGQYTGGALSFAHDQIGPVKESSINADYSYTIRVGETYNLAFGLKGGISLLNIDFSLLNIAEIGDTQFQNNIENRLRPLVGAGVYLYNNNFYAGVSVPTLLSTRFVDDIAISQARQRANFYLITGYVFELNRDWLFKPTFLTKLVTGAPVAFDLSANFLYNEKLTIGAAYRYGTAFSGLVGFQFNENIQLGYSYDYDTIDFGQFNSGSHELFVRFSLGVKRDDRLLSPRFF